MKTPIKLSSPRCKSYAIFAVALGFLSQGLIPAADTTPAAPPPPRMISLVLLLNETRTLDADAAAHAVSRAWGIEIPESAVSARPPSFVVQSAAHGRFALNNVDQPYFADRDKLADEVTDPALAEAIRHHRGWLSVDWLESDEKADLQVVYQHISQIIVQLVRKDTLAIYSPDTDQFHLNDATLLSHLKSPDPLQDLVPAGLADAETGSNPVTIKDDDPQLLAAQAEARKNWPGFMEAFKARGKDQYFAVKGRIMEGETSEYVWLQITDIDDTQVHGKLESDPEALTKVKLGADLHIQIADVDDWLYSTTDGKETRGGYTLRLFDDLKQAEQKN